MYSFANPDFVFQKLMSVELQNESSGVRELSSVIDSIGNNPSYFKQEKPSLIYWLTDSTNLYYWLQVGSKKPHIQQVIFTLLKLLHSLNIQIVPIHVPRDYPLLVMADLGSKWEDSDDWRIDDQSFTYIQDMAGQQVTCDVFSNSTNNWVPKFYSKIPSPGTSGINAFAMDWSGDFNYVCPPVKEIISVIRHILLNPCQGILVVPKWKSAMFWLKLTLDGKTFLPIFRNVVEFKPYLVKGELCTYNVMSGRPNFNFLALVFDFVS